MLRTRDPEPPAQELNKEVEEQFKINMKNKIYDDEVINSPFTETELDNIIRKLKTKKCPGRDEISNEIIL